jgi:hypothetical protein
MPAKCQQTALAGSRTEGRAIERLGRKVPLLPKLRNMVEWWGLGSPNNRFETVSTMKEFRPDQSTPQQSISVLCFLLASVATVTIRMAPRPQTDWQRSLTPVGHNFLNLYRYPYHSPSWLGSLLWPLAQLSPQIEFLVGRLVDRSRFGLAHLQSRRSRGGGAGESLPCTRVSDTSVGPLECPVPSRSQAAGAGLVGTGRFDPSVLHLGDKWRRR